MKASTALLVLLYVFVWVMIGSWFTMRLESWLWADVCSTMARPYEASLLILFLLGWGLLGGIILLDGLAPHLVRRSSD